MTDTPQVLGRIKSALAGLLKSAATHRASALDLKYSRMDSGPMPTDEEWYATEDTAREALRLLDGLGEVDGGWLPIETAPKDGQFWCRRPEPNDDQIVLVQRGRPEHGSGHAVINYKIGRFWRPTHYLPLSAIPAPPALKDAGK